MKFNSALLAACVASLAGGTPATPTAVNPPLALPSPLTDVGSTSVQVASVPDSLNRFLVVVKRTDVLVEKGETLAERVVSLDLVFDVAEDNVSPVFCLF